MVAIVTIVKAQNRAVAIWTRLDSAEPEDPVLAALPPQAKQMAQRSITRLEGMTEPAEVEEMLVRLETMGARVPAEMKPAMDYIRSRAEEKLAELQKEGE